MKYVTLIKKTGIDEQKLIQLYLEGVSYEEIRRNFECTRYIIDRVIKENNIPLREKDKQPVQNKARTTEEFVLKRLEEKKTQSEIARELGVSRQRVHQVLKRSKNN
jgi:DNA invertase Pin-like site-specific DNA recombinase